MSDLHSPAELMDALSAPLGALIAAVGQGVAEAQHAMDRATVQTLRDIYSLAPTAPTDEETLVEAEHNRVLREVGYQPTWYKIPEVDAEISVSLSISGVVEEVASSSIDTDRPVKVATSKIQLYAAPVDANYTNRYDYNIQAASKLRFKIVPVPPSPQAANIRVVPNIVGQKFGPTTDLLDQLDISYEPEIAHPDEQIESVEPPVGSVLVPGQAVIMTFTTLIVPKLAGKTLSEAKEILDDLGIKLTDSGRTDNPVVSSVTPAAGTTLTADQEVRLSFQSASISGSYRGRGGSGPRNSR